MTTVRRILRPRTLACALLLAALPARAQDFRAAATFVQINDVYRIDAVENGAAGGIGRVVTVAERARRATGAPVRVLHAGDFIAPSLESRYFEGQQMIDALNFVHARAPVIAVAGNHEFDERRPGMLANAIKASRFPWLAGNVRLNTGDAAADRRLGADTVIESGGMRIGIFTLTFLDSPREYATWDTAFVALAERSIQALEARGVDAIVGLTHLDLSVDRQIAALRGAHPKLIWIAGGHEHFLIHDPLTDSTAAITKGDSNARRIWQVALGRSGGRPALRADSVVLDASVPIDPTYLRDVQQKWAARMREKVPFFDQVIGRTETRMDASEEVVRNEESAWGSWLADQMRTAFPTIPADVAVLNGGAIRIDDAITGEIRWEHLARTFGFPTRVGLVWLRGRDLRETVLERGVSGGRGEGRFLQVSGLRFAFDRSRPANQRVTSVEIQRGGAWEPLDDNRVYIVAVPDYLFSGGDGYQFHNRAILSVPPGADLRLIAFDALSAAYANGQAIGPRVEGRIMDAGARP
ncbi:bifunctional metallophosphatase/5'-nucleotidase [Longimicrobium sp.]|uniref:bifunctional metallophosphatase/5'-nucleotidase n=1 Tax=Longimicrobium sp. TaxID=2029185 RepID=UPI003B3A7F24